MEISAQVKDFIQEYSKEIDHNEWSEIYSSQDWINLPVEDKGKFTEIMYAAGINPLLYMDSVPKCFLYGGDISGNFIIPNNIINIGEYAFYGCTELTSVIIEGRNSIGGAAFCDCINLTRVTIADNVTSIGNGAFYNCTGLTSVTIGSGVTSIDEGAFYNCTGPMSIIYHGTKKQWDAINKDHGWNKNIGDYIIHCIDGDIEKK